MSKWVKGQSGNPSGRAKGLEREIREEIAALKLADPEHGEIDGWRAMRLRLWKIAMNGEPKDSIAAIKLLHERGYGMPKQAIEVSDGAPSEPEIDWSQVPLEKRRQLLGALAEIEALSAPHDGTEH